MPEWINPYSAQLLAGFMISAAYVPQILRMLKTKSSEDVSMGFLWMILVSLCLMSWYSLDMMLVQEVDSSLALVATNLLNLVMVVLTIFVALKLRKQAKNSARTDSTRP